jgi:hypothetical protein
MTAKDAMTFAAYAKGAAERSLGYDREYFLLRAKEWEARARILVGSAPPLAQSCDVLARVRSARSPVLSDRD